MTNIGRVNQGGRNWEGFGTGPFLADVGAYETILGMRFVGVQACAKHYINKSKSLADMALAAAIRIGGSLLSIRLVHCIG